MWLNWHGVVSSVAFVVMPVIASGQGTIRGCVTDSNGSELPGVEVTLHGPESSRRAVTGESGCYRFVDVPEGAYSVTATLEGFARGGRDHVLIGLRRAVAPVDFVLCVRHGARTEIDWIQWGDLGDAWKIADIVALVRIVATGPVSSECGFETAALHATRVIEYFKTGANHVSGRGLSFRQEKWSDEQTPYRVGQELIVFLTETREGPVRLSGPYYDFQLQADGTVVSHHSPVKTDGMTTADFISRLRGLARKERAQ